MGVGVVKSGRASIPSVCVSVCVVLFNVCILCIFVLQTPLESISSGVSHK